MRRDARIIVLVLLSLVLLYPGCGVKSRPLPPSDVRPQRTTDLQAVSVANGIRIRWSRPVRYTGGGRMRDLGKFEILRAVGGGEPKLLADIPVTDLQRFRQQQHFSYLDTDTQLGMRYRYQIISVTTDGYESLPSNQAEVVRTVPTPTPNPENFVLPTPVPLHR
ncbi:MAG TPA: hypothetical protein VKV05_06410 [Terriglobales bacterium]|jgi:hypothetical protein|nr:hypothetical protein [Terriglobales bacterium]